MTLPRVAIAAFCLLVAGILLSLRVNLVSNARNEASDQGNPAPPPGRESAAPRHAGLGAVTTGGERPVSPLPSEVASPGPESEPGDAAADAPADEPDELRIAALFEGDCRFGARGHCREWRTLADRCDRGDVSACVRLGNLLIDDSPSQPLWGSVVLQRACRLGADDVCDRGDQWNEWSRFGFLSRPLSPGEEPPVELVAACKSGNQVAGGLIEMRRARDGSHDEKAALAACRAGFRDVCAMLMVAADSPAELVRALRAGCDIPDAWLCHALSSAYSGQCPDVAPDVCPTADPGLAARYARVACELDPSIGPCAK